MINLNYLMDHILYQIFKIILNIFKKHRENSDNPSVRIYVNQIENKITLEIKKRYSLELLKPETTKLLGTTENKITKDKNGENASHLEITEVVLVHCNIVKMIINKIQESCTRLFQINHLVFYNKFIQQIIFC